MGDEALGDLGERLRAVREEKGIGLDEAAAATRIPRSYLEALETGSSNVFTSDLHASGFLRLYASFLGVELTKGAKAEGRGLALRKASNWPGALSVGPQPPQKGRSTRVTDALLGLVVLVLVGLVGFAILQKDQLFGLQAIPPTAGPPLTPTATPMPVLDGTAYKLGVSLNYPEHRLEVKQRIDYTNVTSETLPNLMLNVHPNHSRNTFQLNRIQVEMDGELVEPEVYPLDITLRVELPRELNPNEHVAVHLDYALNLPQIDPGEEFSGASFGYSKRSMSLGNWYPVLAPFREEKGWYGLTYFPVGDPYVTDVADYQVTITTTDGVTIAGTGLETHAGNRWHYVADQARSFAFAASDQYDQATAQAGNVTVHSYSFPNNSEAARAALDTATKALQLYAELYGPYPYADYRLVETEFAGGMEFSGLTFLGSAFYDQYDGSTQTPLIPLVAHEVAHQWFYGLVGNDQVTEPWLDEALAEYSGYLYYERHLPDDSAWWWNYAVDQWAPAGKIDTLIYEFRNNRDYLDAVYRRGAQFVRDLRQTMGDPAFFAFLQEYLRRYSYQMVRSQDFFRLVQEFTTADLVPLQEEYFRQRIVN